MLELLLESPDNLIAIRLRYDKALTSLKTAGATEMNSINMKQSIRYPSLVQNCTIILQDG